MKLYLAVAAFAFFAAGETEGINVIFIGKVIMNYFANKEYHVDVFSRTSTALIPTTNRHFTRKLRPLIHQPKINSDFSVNL